MTLCSNCGAVLMRPWWDAGRRAYECQVCHHLTGAAGEPMGLAPTKGRLRTSGLAFLALIVAAIVVLYLFVPSFRALGP